MEYLEGRVLELAGQIAKHAMSAAANAVEIESLEGPIGTMAEDARSLRVERYALSNRLREQHEGHFSELIELKRRASLEEEKMRSLKDQIIGLKNARTDLQGALKERTIALAVASGLALLGVFLGIQKLMGIFGA